jgi:hypothetical protein
MFDGNLIWILAFVAYWAITTGLVFSFLKVMNSKNEY